MKDNLFSGKLPNLRKNKQLVYLEVSENLLTSTGDYTLGDCPRCVKDLYGCNIGGNPWEKIGREFTNNQAYPDFGKSVGNPLIPGNGSICRANCIENVTQESCLITAAAPFPITAASAASASLDGTVVIGVSVAAGLLLLVSIFNSQSSSSLFQLRQSLSDSIWFSGCRLLLHQKMLLQEGVTCRRSLCGRGYHSGS
jgi:hypothetical protein